MAGQGGEAVNKGALGNIAEQFIDATRANFFEHRGAGIFGLGQVAHFMFSYS
jgi:hypothetical protein